MTSPGKGSAVADAASRLAEEGTSVALTGGRAENPGGGGEADLFLALDAEAGLFGGQTIAPPVRRGPGRPAGSPNRSTLQLQRWLQAKGYRDPAEFLASVVSMDTRELAAVLKGTRAGEVATVTFDQAAEALRVQMRAASELMPYFHQRMPQQVEHRGDGARPLIIIADGAAGGRSPSGGDGAMSVFDHEEIQGLARHATDGSAATSHDDGSHDEG